jgi:hypothetical protein
MFVCILRTLMRPQNTHKHVLQDELRRSRNMYGTIASTVRIALTKFHPDVENGNSRRASGSHGLSQAREQVAVLSIALNGTRLNVHDEKRGLS